MSPPAGRSALARLLAALLALVALVAVTGRWTDTPPAAPAPREDAPPPASLGRDGALAISVVDASGCTPGGACDGPPVAGARVRAFVALGGRHWLGGRGVTGADGRLELSGLPRGETWVLADADGLARASVALVVDGTARAVRLGLGAAHALEVSVVDERGEPLDGATVLVTGGEPLPFGALTDERGAVRLTRLGAPPWTVRASAPGHETVTQSGAERALTLELRRLGSLQIRVTDPAGAPAPAARITLAGSALWPARTVETGDDGSVRVAGLLAGSYDLSAAKGDLVSETLVGYVLERGADAEVTLGLAPGRRVTVRVTAGEEDDAPPVAGADVTLVEAGLGSFPLRGRTGADGEVALGPLPRGPASIAVRADGFVARSAVPVPDELDGPVRVALLAGGALVGAVVDAQDRPVDGATIEVVGTDVTGQPISETPLLLGYRRHHFEWALPGPTPLLPAGELGVMPGPVPPIPRLGEVVAGAPPSAPPEALDPWVTRGDGTFLARPVTPGRVRALVRHPAYVEGWSDPVVLGPGGEARVKVVLLAGGALEGRVLDEAGRALEGVRVDVSALRGTLERTTFTATDGSFAFAAVPSDVQISLARAEDPSRIVKRVRVEVEEGGRTKLDVTLPAPREPLEVAVTDERGAPIPSAQVSVLSLDAELPLRETRFTDEAGAVTIPDARGLRVRVRVEAPGYAARALWAEAAPARLAVELERGVAVEGRVTTLSGRRPLAGARVTLLGEGLRKVALTDDDGRYAFRDVAPGAVVVSASHAGLATFESSAVVERPTRDDRAFELPTIDLGEEGEVEGEVVDASGRAVPGARVASGAVPAYLPAGALPPGVVATDARGRFRLRGLPAGDAELEAYSAEVGRGAARVTIVSGRTAGGVRIVLDAPTGEPETPARGGVAVTLGERTEDGRIVVVLVQVAAGSEAERAGLLPGDVLRTIDDVAPSDLRDARLRLSGPPTTDVVLELARDDEVERVRLARELTRR
ncbi:MAG: carboxypeptidase regulatory-like domain-containing protein [Polyangiaceae bacterium]|nr:carboxypeptidase regulatory-like domain-containing protein [Polyangiaceae bacterium]